MSLSAADRFAIADLISSHGHLFDNGELDRLDELFTEDVRYDVSDLGGGVLQGPVALREAAQTLGDRNPVAHHVTNIVLTEIGPDEVRALSKGLAVMTDGRAGSATYQDTIVRLPAGWRIAHRIVRARRTPLTA